VNSPFGRVLVSIRDNPARTRALGYSVRRYKITAFVLSAFLAGLGGGLFAIAHGFVSLDTVHWTTSGEAVIVVVLGGIGTLWGGVIGSVLLVWLEDRLSVAGFTLVGLITGSIFVVVVLAFRRGIWGTVRALFHRERDGRR
jgi:branched-chain amino acid transport system permease protein